MRRLRIKFGGFELEADDVSSWLALAAILAACGVLVALVATGLWAA